jgi:hypothetical protein
MNSVSSLVASDFAGCGVLSVELESLRSVSLGSSGLRKWDGGGEFWVRKRRGGFVVRCGGDERSGSKSRTGAQRIERAQEATKRRAATRASRKLYSRPLLTSLHARINQNHWVSALEVRLSSQTVSYVSKFFLPPSYAQS